MEAAAARLQGVGIDFFLSPRAHQGETHRKRDLAVGEMTWHRADRTQDRKHAPCTALLVAVLGLPSRPQAGKLQERCEQRQRRVRAPGPAGILAQSELHFLRSSRQRAGALEPALP